MKIKNGNLIGLVLSVIIIIAGINLYRYFMLKKTEETYAVFIERNIGVGITQKYFKFQTKDKEKVIASIVYRNKIEIGDTVWIEYSISNPKVIKVIDKDYKKHMTEVNR